MAFFPKIPSVNKKSKQKPNPMSKPAYLYLSRSTLLVGFTYPNKQLPNVKSVFKCLNCEFSV